MNRCPHRWWQKPWVWVYAPWRWAWWRRPIMIGSEEHERHTLVILCLVIALPWPLGSCEGESDLLHLPAACSWPRDEDGVPL